MHGRRAAIDKEQLTWDEHCVNVLDYVLHGGDDAVISRFYGDLSRRDEWYLVVHDGLTKGGAHAWGKANFPRHALYPSLALALALVHPWGQVATVKDGSIQGALSYDGRDAAKLPLKVAELYREFVQPNLVIESIEDETPQCGCRPDEYF